MGRVWVAEERVISKGVHCWGAGALGGVLLRAGVEAWGAIFCVGGARSGGAVVVG